MANIGVVGMGVVGNAVTHYHVERGDLLWTYDKAMNPPEMLAALNEKAEVVFICVGTPYAGIGKGLDCSEVRAAVDALSGEKTVIIKSTVMPGTTDAIQEKHPEHRVFYVPEFLSEDTAKEDYVSPKRQQLIGGPTEGTWKVADLFPWWWPDIERRAPTQHLVLPAYQAEVLKLATNAFYALKVAFANTLYDAGMAQETLDALGADPWIGGEHFTIEHKGYRGFGGRCLPKDVSALMDWAEQEGAEPLRVLITLILGLNEQFLGESGRSMKEWL